MVTTNSTSPLASKPSSLQRGRQVTSSPGSHSLGFLDSSQLRSNAPPLPPRSCKSSIDESDHSPAPPPIHPKRVPKKGSVVSLLPQMLASPEEPVRQHQQHHRPPPAPPLPPKTVASAAPSHSSSLDCPPPVPPHRSTINNSTSFSNPLDLGSGSGSLVDEVCSLLAASGCQVMSNGNGHGNGHGNNNESPSPPPQQPAPLAREEPLYSKETT